MDLYGWYSPKQRALVGTCVYELLDPEVTDEARRVMIAPRREGGLLAVHVTQVTNGTDTEARFDDMVRVGRVGRFVRNGDRPSALVRMFF